MRYEIELKTISSEKEKRAIPLEELKNQIDIYSEGNKGLIILHESFFDYKYDTSGINYSKIDSKCIIGYIESSELKDDKVFITVNINEELNDKYICFYRSTLNVKRTNVLSLEDLTYSVLAVDLVRIADKESENISLTNYSDIKRLS